MEYEHLGFVEAVQELAGRVGLTVPREALAAADDSGNQELYDILEQTAAYYRRQLREHSGAARAVEYLKKRGLSGEIAATLRHRLRAAGLGQCPQGTGRRCATRTAAAPRGTADRQTGRRAL